jgi:predicted  nucleic acid-binding Zn-ribbon protein
MDKLIEKYIQQNHDNMTQLIISYKEESAIWNSKYQQLQTELDDLKKEKTDILTRLQESESKYLKLQEEIRDFKSVSRLVAITNENMKLKSKIEVLERSLNARSKTEESKKAPATPVLEVTEEQQSQESVEPPEEEQSYYEIDIKGIQYYMNDAEIVFNIEEDGSVGEAVAEYKTVKGKKKLIWGKQQ